MSRSARQSAECDTTVRLAGYVFWSRFLRLVIQVCNGECLAAYMGCVTRGVSLPCSFNDNPALRGFSPRRARWCLCARNSSLSDKYVGSSTSVSASGRQALHSFITIVQSIPRDCLRSMFLYFRYWNRSSNSSSFALPATAQSGSERPLAPSMGSTLRSNKECIRKNTLDREQAVMPSAAWRSSFEFCSEFT